MDEFNAALEAKYTFLARTFANMSGTSWLLFLSSGFLCFWPTCVIFKMSEQKKTFSRKIQLEWCVAHSKIKKQPLDILLRPWALSASFLGVFVFFSEKKNLFVHRNHFILLKVWQRRSVSNSSSPRSQRLWRRGSTSSPQMTWRLGFSCIWANLLWQKVPIYLFKKMFFY